MANPFEIAHDGLWTLVDDFQPFKDSFKKGNVINLNDLERRAPLKENILTGDLPEVVLVMAGGTGNLHRTSNTSNIIQRWDWLISTGLRRLTLISDLKWYTFQALWRWKIQGYGALTFAGESFIIRCDWINVLEGESDPERNRSIVGWSTVISIETEFEFSRTQMEFTE